MTDRRNLLPNEPCDLARNQIAHHDGWRGRLALLRTGERAVRFDV